ncbi:hypothetical protein Cri9333_3919 [Crinalium epipsammum PCC 9333]|uniref:Uncharacterized protein n=2 Tax=Crinalium TaxID=241421 RepID=K9W2Y5_9CYAN|nr:hypothetical protein Cri9333_3919 [Crinalium epipsammum PCC 9333]
MKHHLQRIEKTLNYLSQSNFTQGQQHSARENSMNSQNKQPQKPQVNRSPSVSMTVLPMPKQHQYKTPALPKVTAPNLTQHRIRANPAMAITVLKEIEQKVVGWQQQLQQTLKKIQDVYSEGPIIDGWIESTSQNQSISVKDRHQASMPPMMDYVTEIVSQPDGKFTVADYRLCGLDADGMLWERPCPCEQVKSVSMAIARYHKLCQLLNQKQDLENRLTQLTETLMVLQDHLSTG